MTGPVLLQEPETFDLDAWVAYRDQIRRNRDRMVDADEQLRIAQATIDTLARLPDDQLPSR